MGVTLRSGWVTWSEGFCGAGWMVEDMVKLAEGYRFMRRLTCQNMRFAKILASQNFRRMHNVICHQTYLREIYHENHPDLCRHFRDWRML